MDNDTEETGAEVEDVLRTSSVVAVDGSDLGDKGPEIGNARRVVWDPGAVVAVETEANNGYCYFGILQSEVSFRKMKKQNGTIIDYPNEKDATIQWLECKETMGAGDQGEYIVYQGGDIQEIRSTCLFDCLQRAEV